MNDKLKKVMNKLACRDSLEFLKEFIPDESIDCVISDLPYNISDASKITMVGVNVVKAEFGSWDKRSWEEYDKFIIDHLKEFQRVLKPGGNCLLWLDRAYAGIAWRFAEELGFLPKNIIAAVKTNALPHIRKSNLRSGWEACLWISKGKPAVFNFGTQIEMINVIPYQIGNTKATDHPCEKYRPQIEPLVKWFTNPGDVVLDCFCGTAIVPVVCREMGRNFIACDKEQKWIDQAKIRLRKTQTALF